jgi:tetratricopeptide (TPR) repeat protein
VARAFAKSHAKGACIDLKETGAAGFKKLSVAAALMGVDSLTKAGLKALRKWLDGRLAGPPTLLVSSADLDPEFRTFLDGHEAQVLNSGRLRFERDETRALLRERLNAIPAEDLVQAVHEVTGGTPRMLTHLLPENRDVRALRLALQDPVPPPDTLEFVANRLLPLLSAADATTASQLAVFRRMDPHRVQAITGTKKAAKAILDRLESLQLVSTVGDETRFSSPLLRESLRHLFNTRDPKAIIRAEAAAAKHLLRAGPEEFAPEIVAHLLAAGRTSDALTHVERTADRLLTMVSASRLLGWLTQLTSTEGALPFHSSALHAQVLSAGGRWEEARAAISHCETLLRGDTTSKATQTAGYARIAAVQAHIAWLRGRANEANAYCNRALAALRQARRQPGDLAEERVMRLHFELLQLDARLKLEAGQHDQARDILLNIAREAEASDQLMDRADALKDLGVLAKREGRVSVAVEHFDAALPLANRSSSPGLYGTIRSHLAGCHVMLGEYDLARTRLEEALSVRRSVNPEEVAYSLLVSAALHVSMEDTDHAETDYQRALELVGHGANMRMRAEVLSRYGSLLARTGNPGEASRLIDRIRTFVGDLRRVEPSLAALIDMTRGAISVGELRLHDAATTLTAARDAFARISFRYHEAQASLLLAEVIHLRCIKRGARMAPEVRTHVEHAAKIANAHGYDFGQPSRFEPLFDVATRIGGVEARQHTLRVRGEVPELSLPPEPVEGEPSQGMYRLLSPDGERLIARNEAERLRTTMNAQHLNVFHLDDTCVIHHRGQRQTGELKRVILPLMRTLMRQPGHEVRAPDLASAVWGEGPYDQRARTRLKVAISRLRTLLGPDACHLRTIPGTGPQRSSKTCYVLDRELPFIWVEAAEDVGIELRSAS